MLPIASQPTLELSEGGVFANGRRHISLSGNGTRLEDSLPEAQATALAKVRESVVAMHAACTFASSALEKMTPLLKPASRSDSLLSLEEQIGPKPEYSSWEDEWPHLVRRCRRHPYEIHSLTTQGLTLWVCFCSCANSLG